jgi:hypothetical protein
MHPHGGLVDVRLEGVVVVGKGRDLVRHVAPLIGFVAQLGLYAV